MFKDEHRYDVWERIRQQDLREKSAVHFRAAFGPIAGSIFNVDAAGIQTHDFAKLPHVKRTRPIFPVEIEPSL